MMLSLRARIAVLENELASARLELEVTKLALARVSNKIEKTNQ